MTDEQNVAQTETPDEKRRRLNRERQRKYRALAAKEKDRPESFEHISKLWEKHEAQLLKENPALHARLSARHDAVEELEAEAAEIEKSVEGLPVDLSFQDIRKDTAEQGTANYRQVEAAALEGVPLDEINDYYRRYGFRLRIQSDVLQQARELLVLYALGTQDESLDWAIVEEAIADCAAYQGFSPNAAKIRELIRQYRGLPKPKPHTEQELIQRTLSDLHQGQLSADSI